MREERRREDRRVPSYFLPLTVKSPRPGPTPPPSSPSPAPHNTPSPSSSSALVSICAKPILSLLVRYEDATQPPATAEKTTAVSSNVSGTTAGSSGSGKRKRERQSPQKRKGEKEICPFPSSARFFPHFSLLPSSSSTYPSFSLYLSLPLLPVSLISS